MWRTVALFLLMTAVPALATAEPDRFKITDAEKAACTMDAMRLCSGTYPNEDRLLYCMKENRASLSPTCLAAFDAGVKRRRL